MVNVPAVRGKNTASGIQTANDREKNVRQRNQRDAKRRNNLKRRVAANRTNAQQ